MSTMAPTWVATPSDLDRLELIAGGMLPGIDGYCLPDSVPASWPLASVLAVPSPVAEEAMSAGKLLIADADNTPLYELEVSAIASGAAQSHWVAGRVRQLRRPEHGQSRGFRLSREVDFSESHVGLFRGRVNVAELVDVIERAQGRRLELICVSSADSFADSRVARDLRECAARDANVRFWYLPAPSFCGSPSADSTLNVVLTGLGVARFDDCRHDPDPSQSGAVILLTGLSGAGKSTLARALTEAINAGTQQRAILLDGDDVRRELSAELGFSREGRERNLSRLAWVAARIAEVGGVAVCAPIAPFAASRAAMRAKTEPGHPFIIVYLETTLEVAESRDRKGLYARARAGELRDFTGIDSPYEVPLDADLSLDAGVLSPDECLIAVLEMLKSRGLV